MSALRAVAALEKNSLFLSSRDRQTSAPQCPLRFEYWVVLSYLLGDCTLAR